MKREIEVINVHTYEPQHERSLQSLQNQSVPFANIRVFANYVPFHAVRKEALETTEHKWICWIAGDITLNENAHEMAQRRMADALHNYGRKRFLDILCFRGRLWDAFRKCRISGFRVWNVEGLRKIGGFSDHLFEDVEIVRRYNKMQKFGKTSGDITQQWLNREETFGEHFRDPDEFQVFCRFFRMGNKIASGKKRKGTPSKARREEMEKELRMLAAETPEQRELYQLAMSALNYGFKVNDFPTSPNRDLERRHYDHWKKEEQ